MKALLIKGVVSFALLTSVAVAPVGAALIDRGAFNDGFGGGTMHLIYDTDLDITWLGDANFAKTSGFDGNGKMDWTNGHRLGRWPDGRWVHRLAAADDDAAGCVV